MQPAARKLFEDNDISFLNIHMWPGMVKWFVGENNKKLIKSYNVSVKWIN